MKRGTLCETAEWPPLYPSARRPAIPRFRKAGIPQGGSAAVEGMGFRGTV